MKLFEIGTGYTPIPARISAATELVVEELTKAFLELGVPVEIIDIAADDRQPNQLPIRQVRVPKQFSGTDIQLGVMHKLKRVVYSLALAGELRKVLRETEEKVVLHFHNQYNLFFFFLLTTKALRRKCIIAYTNHSGIWSLEWEEIEKTIQKRYFQEAFCMKRADVVFLLNEKTKQTVTERLNVPQERVSLIANGVNTQVYRPMGKEETDAAGEKWGLDGRTVILQVGSVNENKGQLRSLQKLLPLMKRDPSLTFAYAGGVVEEEYQQRIGRFAQENGVEQQVRYLGMVAPGEELNGLYNVAAATILSSRYEGFVLVAAESAASGTPVILDEDGPIRVECGGIRCREETVAETVRHRILDGGAAYDALCAEARKQALDRYSWNRVAEDYLKVWSRFEPV